MLSDLLTAFKGCDKVIFRLTGCGEQEHETAEFKDAIEAIEALQVENEQLKAQAARMWEALKKAREALERVQWIDNYGDKRGKHCDYCARNPEEGHSNSCIIGQAIAAIDKVLGGKEDV